MPENTFKIESIGNYIIIKGLDTKPHLLDALNEVIELQKDSPVR